ncbi:MAG: gamma-glutamylcyclotransferase [Fibrella sp.]|nr:gamma-glutamylcyclotransferase [Armatimonadota bacterium]
MIHNQNVNPATTDIESDAPDKEMLFVYGTLRPGGVASGKLPLLHCPVGTATVSGVLYDLGAYPGIVLTPNDPANQQRVVGDVLAISRKTLRFADTYEGYEQEKEDASWYTRKRVVARFNDGSSVLCWVYAVNLQRFPKATHVESGDWLKHCETKTEWFPDTWPD